MWYVHNVHTDTGCIAGRYVGIISGSNTYTIYTPHVLQSIVCYVQWLGLTKVMIGVAVIGLEVSSTILSTNYSLDQRYPGFWCGPIVCRYSTV